MMIRTMARHPETDDADTTASVERVAETAADARTGRFAGPGRHDFPEGVIALREYSEGGRFYVTISEVVDDLGYEAGSDYLHVFWDHRQTPPAFQLEHVPNPTGMDESDPKVRKIIDNGTTARLTLPGQDLGEYGVGIDIDNYDEEDPFLFEPVYVETDELFYLNPLGHVSEVFRYDERIRSPIPEAAVAETASAEDISEPRLQELLDMVSMTLATETFEAAGFPLSDAEPDIVSISGTGQRLALHYAPSPENRSVFREVLTGIYDASEAEATACWSAHQKFAKRLLTELATAEYGEPHIPDDHPINDPETEAIVIPLDPPETDGSSTEDTPSSMADQSDSDASPMGGESDETAIQRERVPPIEPSIISLATQSFVVDAEALREGLDTLTSTLTADRLSESGIQIDRDPVTVSFQPSAEMPVDYSNVRIHFVAKHGLEELAKSQTNLAPEIAEACRNVHNKQAEQLLSRRGDVPAEYRRFREDSDAVLVPVTTEADGGTDE